MKYKATDKFKELGIEDNYQGLETHQYFNLLGGRLVEIKTPPKRLLEGKYIEKVKEIK